MARDVNDGANSAKTAGPFSGAIWESRAFGQESCDADAISGVDPESDFSATDGGDTPSEFQTFAAPMYVILRVNLRF